MLYFATYVVVLTYLLTYAGRIFRPLKKFRID